jgi:hypothetical protein
VTHLRQIMLKELERRNYAMGTIRSYIRTVEHFALDTRELTTTLGPRLWGVRASNSPCFRCRFQVVRCEE